MKFIYFMFFLNMAIGIEETPLKIKGLIAFLRHGARGPMKAFKALENTLKWNNVFHGLTQLGQHQHYLLGRTFRKKYVHELGLLSPKYHPEELVAFSSHTQRTIESGYCFMLGLYNKGLSKMNDKQLAIEELELISPYTKELKDSSLPFDVPIVPITVQNYKYSLVNSLKNCTLYHQAKNDFFNSSEFAKIATEYNETVSEICDRLDIGQEDVKGKNLKILADYLVATRFQGLVKFEDDLWSKFSQMHWSLGWHKFLYNNVSEKVSLYTFRKNIMPIIERIFAGDKNEPKTQFHFSHDDLIMSYVKGLNLPYNYSYSLPYASQLVFELLEDTSLSANDPNYHKIRILVNFVVLQEPISLNELKSRVDKVANQINQPIEEFCAGVKAQSSSSSYFIYILGVAALFFSTISVIIVWYYLNSTKKKSEATKISSYGIPTTL